MSGRIAFVDYDLDNFHANTFLDLLRGSLAKRGFELTACRGIVEPSSRAWAEKNGVAYCEGIEALAGLADAIMILAPSNPETHLDLAREFLPLGRPTYVDKTFAPDLDTARAIFALADEHVAPMFTSSALRFDRVLRGHVADAERVLHMQTWGGGANFAEYAIHPVEMVVSVMGADVERMERRGAETHARLELTFSGGRSATAHVYTEGRCPYASMVTTAARTVYLEADRATLFENLLAEMLTFFETGAEPVGRNESLAIRRILDEAGA